MIIRGCKMAKHEEVKNGVIFPVGEKKEAFAKYFVGQSYLKTLVADPKVNVGVGNVTFEPGCRNNWAYPSKWVSAFISNWRRRLVPRRRKTSPIFESR
jgi:hypothetical protein